MPGAIHMRKTLALFVAFALLLPLEAQAQQSESTSTGSQLAQLATLLGTMQMLQSLCSPQDQDFWRERMQEMIRLEKPSREQQNALINAFNSGYNSAKSKFDPDDAQDKSALCTAEAHALAIDTAHQGEALAQVLSNAVKAGDNPG